MHREIRKWYSSNLNKDMEIAVYGHYGFALLMFLTAGADFLKYLTDLDSFRDNINDEEKMRIITKTF
ncbi:hypothetical protein BMS3Abin04_00483 [bacterium BMS3Abin04]|nr:hypothetical protein BMS3Abin04_00483 [bacterium BMS3Abin04]